MSQNICNICGANYEYRNGRWVCPACGAYKAEELSNEEVTLLYNAAQKLRLSDFDEAEKAYADIIVKYPQNSEGYWGRLLSRFGIKYEEDFDGKQIPTCYATIESIISDKDYVKAISLADEDTKEYYVKQAEYIERVRKEWVEKARKEKSYDIFISYKDSDTQNGIERTKDSIAAQDLYIHLTRKGYRVFFSRESLRDKVGEKFEPYIFGALSTAKVMLVYGSSSEYITSTWVKNEWMRFEKRVQAGEKKKNSLIVACDGCSPAELPKVLSSMQCLDATKRSFYEDLDNAIDKIIKVEEKPKEQVTEKKKVKKLPIVLGAVAALIAILCCIIIPNVTNQEITSLTNSYYGITVEADRDVFPKGTELKIEEVLSGEKYDMVKNAIGEKSESFKIYDIELEGKKTVDINGTVTVKIPLPNNMSTTGISAYYISDKGVAENLDCSVADGYVTFKTTHFSLYVIAEDKVNNTGFDYKINSDDTVTLNKYTGNETEVVIPQTIEGKTVVEIGSLAFDSLDRITSVVIPETVTTIGAKAFYGCTSIKSITIPSTVTSIGTSAFYGWNNSQEIILAGCKDIPTGWNAQWNGSCNAKLVYGLITIIFHANGGSGTMSNQMIEINSSALVNENKFTLAGYTFSGWATTENGEVAILDKGSYTVEKESVYHLYAVWSANENKVIFDANGGEGSMATQTIRTDEKANLSNCTFEKEGYTFGGWATTASGNVVYSNGGLYSMGTASENTLYAIWIPNNNALIFNSNGGYGSMDSITVETNETITIPKNVFTLDGYTFLGWSDVQNGSVKYTDEQSFTMSSSATVTLYAVWRANENELTFNSNDGTNTETSINMNTGETANLPTNTFTRNGYTFLGWSTSSNGTVEYTDTASYTMGATSTTLYAVWSANENKVIFNANGGNGIMNAQTIKTDACANLNNCAFEREGYIFAGWATTPTGNVVYTNGASYTMGTNSEYTLYAIWTTADYRIDYVLNGGTNSNSNPAGFDINDNTITLAEPTRNGYTFLGWFSDTNFQTPCNTIPSGSTGNKTFYASWSANENTVHFNANGGSGSIADLKIKTDASAKLTKNTITRDGYTFKGWSTIADGSVEYADEATYTMGANSEYTLYAVWQASTNTAYTVNHYCQNINDDGYTLKEAETCYGTTATTVTATPKTYNGFITPAEETVTILADGSAVLSYYYARNSYTVSFVTNGGNFVSEQTYRYEQEANLPTTTRTDYTFGGWFLEEQQINEVGTLNVTTNIVLYAWWEEENKANDFSYGTSYNDGETIIIDGYKGTSTTMQIPSYIGGNSVSGIAGSAFVGKAEIRKVVVPNSITSIGYGAFNGCSAIEEMTLPFVGQYADNQFADTNTLFCYIFGSTKFTNSVAASQINPASGGSNTYYLPSSLTTVNITGGYLRHGAFSGCTNIQVVNLSNIKAFEERVFYRCVGLTTVNIPNGITAIPSAFESCTSLTSVSLPQGLKSIEGAFAWCTSLTTIDIPDTVENIDGAFANSGITNIEIPTNVLAFTSTFYYCSNLTSIEIPSTVTGIGGYAFFGSGLTSISIPNSVTSIGSSAFYECHSLVDVHIPKTMTAIGSTAFANCSRLENVYIKDINAWCAIDFQGMFANPLYYADNLYLNGSLVTSLDSCTTVNKIAPYAFWGYSAITNITIPDNITEIGENAFECCANLESVTINKGVSTIGDYAFGSCDKLTIYCEVSSKPSGWSDSWNMDVNSTACAVVWFYIGDIWDGTKASSFAGGMGTEEDPYLISTAEQLAYLVSSYGSSGKYYLLTADIDLMKLEWQKISSTNTFYGYFDGGNHTIYNLNIQDSKTVCQGLFSTISGGYIKNLKVINAEVNNSAYYIGILCGSVSASSVIENCYVQGSITSIIEDTSARIIGGIVGDCTGSISRCGANVDIVATSPASLTVGGIAGECGLGRIENCYTEGNIELKDGTKHYLGGIVGLYGWTTIEDNSISNCYSRMNLSSKAQTSSYVGGIVGSVRYKTQINNCFAEGDISSTVTLKSINYAQLGRIIGYINYTETTLQNCYSSSSQICKRSGTDSTLNEPSNSCESLQNEQVLQSENFIYNILGWSSDVWQINEGAFPTLK